MPRGPRVHLPQAGRVAGPEGGLPLGAVPGQQVRQREQLVARVCGFEGRRQREQLGHGDALHPVGQRRVALQEKEGKRATDGLEKHEKKAAGTLLRWDADPAA